MAVGLRIVLTQESQSQSANRSTVRADVYADSSNGSFNNDNKPGSLTLDGQNYSFSNNFAANVSTLLFSISKFCYHDYDGKKTVSANASYVTGVSSGTIYDSDSKVLSVINTTPTNITSFTPNPDPLKDKEICNLSWGGATTPNYAIDYYKLYVRRYKNGVWSSYVQIGGNITGTSYNHDVKTTYTDLKAGEIIQYKVYTHNTAGKTSSGYEVSNTVDIISSATIYVNVAGIMKKGNAYINVAGVMKKAVKVWIKKDGVWKPNQ